MLRLRDLREVYVVLDQCLQFGADPDGWRHRLADGARGLFKAPIVINGEFIGMYDPARAHALHVIDTGWVTPEQKLAFVHYELDGANRTDPLRAAFDRKKGPLMVASGVATLGYDAYTGSDTYQRYMAPAGIGDQLVAISRIGEASEDRWNMISVIRGSDEPPFSARDRRLMRILAGELKPLVGTRLADSTSAVMQLTPRQHLTLRLLLGGGSEAEVAKAMSLSPATLHKYVISLYRLFGVKSRAALQAMFAGRGRLSSEREQTADPRQHRARREGVPMTTPWRAPSTIRRGSV